MNKSAMFMDEVLAIYRKTDLKKVHESLNGGMKHKTTPLLHTLS